MAGENAESEASVRLQAPCLHSARLHGHHVHQYRPREEAEVAAAEECSQQLLVVETAALIIGKVMAMEAETVQGMAMPTILVKSRVILVQI